MRWEAKETQGLEDWRDDKVSKEQQVIADGKVRKVEKGKQVMKVPGVLKVQKGQRGGQGSLEQRAPGDWKCIGRLCRNRARGPGLREFCGDGGGGDSHMKCSKQELKIQGLPICSFYLFCNKFI